MGDLTVQICISLLTRAQAAVWWISRAKVTIRWINGVKIDYCKSAQVGLTDLGQWRKSGSLVD